MGLVAAQSFSLKDGSSILLRVAQEEDAASLLGLLDIVMLDGVGQVAKPGEIQFSLEQEICWIQKIMSHPQKLLLVAEHAESLVGMIDFQIGERKRLAHRGVFGLSVLPEWRGKGIGAALLGALIAWAEHTPGIEKICLTVRADNLPAIALYKKLGFVEEGRRVKEIKLAEGVYVDDVLMYRWVADGH